MELAHAGLLTYLAYVVLVDATTGEDDDASCGECVEGAQQTDALKGGGLLTGSQDTVNAELDELFEGEVRVAAAVEGTMERHGHSFGSLNEATVGVHIQRSVRVQTAYHNAVNAKLTANTDVFQHTLHLKRRIEEVSAARTDDDVQTGGGKQTACHLYLSVRRRRAALGNARTKFHTVSAAFLRCQTTLHAIGAYLKLKVFSHYYII